MISHRRIQGQAHPEQRALAYLALDFDGAAVGRHDLLGNKQPQAQARGYMAGGYALELLENPLLAQALQQLLLEMNF